MATGESVSMPVTAKLALEVDVPPRRKSRVEAYLGVIAPAVMSQSSPDASAHDDHEGVLAPDTKHRPVDPVAAAATTPVVSAA